MFLKRALFLFLIVSVSTLLFLGVCEARQSAKNRRNVIIFVADGLRPGSVNATDAPTLLGIRQNGVNFVNSHALFPTFTTPNSRR